MKKIKRQNTAKIVYRIYKNENGLLLQSTGNYFNPDFPDFEHLDDAIDAMERYKPICAEFVVLPVLIVNIKEKQC